MIGSTNTLTEVPIKKYCQYDGTNYINKGFTVSNSTSYSITIPNGVTTIKVTIESYCKANTSNASIANSVVAYLNGAEVVAIKYGGNNATYQGATLTATRIISVKVGDVITLESGKNTKVTNSDNILIVEEI